MGRRSTYTPELAAAICERLAAGESLRAICEPDDMPAHSTVLRWVNVDKEFADHYARARDVGLDVMADELLDIADEPPGTVFPSGGTDNGAVAHQKLRVDTRKWYLSKLAPKRYGDRLNVDAEVKGTLTVISGVPESEPKVPGSQLV